MKYIEVEPLTPSNTIDAPKRKKTQPHSPILKIYILIVAIDTSFLEQMCPRHCRSSENVSRLGSND